jgi:hypothetical protein
MIERAAREEQQEIDRAHGEHLLHVTDYSKERQRSSNPLIEILNRAYEAKADEEE